MRDDSTRLKARTAPRPIREGFLAFLIVFGVSTFSIASIYFQASNAQVSAVQSELNRLARQSAALVDPGLHAQLHSPEQMNSETYNAALLPLTQFHKSLPEIFYIYTLVKQDEGLFFVLDTSNRPDLLQFDREMEPSLLMDLYEDPGPTTLEAYEKATPMTDAEPYTDEFGTFISGYAPIFDKTGERIAIIGVDLELSDFHSRMYPVRKKAWTATAMAFLIACLTGFGLARSRRGSARKAKQLSTAMEDLYQAKNAAEKATTAKSQFLATISHEIRTPLNGLIGVLHLLEDAPKKDKQKLLLTAHNCADDLQVLLGDVLDFSKMEADKMTVETEATDAEFICSNLHDLHTPLIAEKSLKFEFQTEPTTPLYCIADPIRLRQILNNLLNNAIKFTSKGSVTLKLAKVQNASNESVVRFEIQDTGPGIPQNIQPQLFQPFTQENATTTRKFGGSGLGLSISRKLVELMDGTIGVDSTVGKGSTFWFELPATDIRPKNTTPSHSSPAQATDSKKDLSKLRVLIVDDNITNRMIATALCRQKHSIVADTAEDGQKALDRVSENEYDIIFMDCMMPEMDGYQATQAIRSGEAGENAKNTFIIALTANTSNEDRQACIDSGMNDYLAKPIQPEPLAEILNKWAYCSKY